jgi:serine/threonine protein kinase
MADEPIDLFPHFQIQKSISIRQEDFQIELACIPKQYINGEIRMGGVSRCFLEYGAKVWRGGHGSISKVRRIKGASTTDMCVKAPHNPQYSLCPESLFQWMAYTALEQAGITGAVPKVYDIFQYAGEVRFSMEYIYGVSSIQKILESENHDLVFLQILVQTSILLGVLEEKLHLDHRDLKADNLWIRPAPIDYTISIGGIKWTFHCPFQVVILDFGFSCIGGSDGNAIISLSDGILPKVDPCPKEGRDLFQLLTSLWSIPEIRACVSSTLSRDIEEFLSYRNISYSAVMKQLSQPHWIYLLVSDPAFRYPPLHPLSLLRILSIKYESLELTSG